MDSSLTLRTFFGHTTVVPACHVHVLRLIQTTPVTGHENNENQKANKRLSWKETSETKSLAESAVCRQSVVDRESLSKYFGST